MSALSNTAMAEDISPFSSFNKYFTVDIAKTDSERLQLFKLRHRVYCEELAFEPQRPNKCESDTFDAHSIHCIATHHTGLAAGTVRLVTSNNEHEKLPIEAFCSFAITDPHLNPSKFERNQICEISRLAVPVEFRKAASNNDGVTFALVEDERQAAQYISVALYLSVAAIAMNTQKYHMFVMMEPRLARALSRTGIHFKMVGEAIDYHGTRAPYYLDVRTLLETLEHNNRVMMLILQQRFANN